MQTEINWLAEFRDKKRDKEFHDMEVRKDLRITKIIVLFFGLFNFLFVILDYFNLQYSDISVIIHYSLFPRGISLVLALIVFSVLTKARDKSAAVRLVTVFAVLAYLLHEYTAAHFAPVELVYEALDLVLITYGLFIVPNRWITNVCVSVLINVLFFVLAPFTMPTMTGSTKATIAIYLITQLLIVSVLMHQIHYQKRLNYIQRLQLEILAKTDVLTRAYNRVALDKTLEQMCDSRHHFSLILVDIDDFKHINDTYGHLTGDKVLVKIVNAIKNIVRADDIVARWGGEEFMVILPNTARERAAETAARINKYLSSVEYADTKDRVTASFGVTAFTDGDDKNSLIGRADLLLYQAKEQGKNIVVTG